MDEWIDGETAVATFEAEGWQWFDSRKITEMTDKEMRDGYIQLRKSEDLVISVTRAVSERTPVDVDDISKQVNANHDTYMTEASGLDRHMLMVELCRLIEKSLLIERLLGVSVSFMTELFDQAKIHLEESRKITSKLKEE